MIELVGIDISEATCLSVVAALDKFHRRLLAVQRLLMSDKQWSSALIFEVAQTISARTSASLLNKWIEQLESWRNSWTNDNQPHGAVKFLEGALVEHMHRGLVSLTVSVVVQLRIICI